MAYATAQQMMVRFSTSDVAQIATPEGSQVVDTRLMQLTVSGGNRDAWSLDEIGVADKALERIQFALEEAGVTMDSYLAIRYPLPLDAGRVSTTRLPGICCDIARYLLQSNQDIEVVTTRHNAALAWLKDLSAGKAGLGESLSTPQGGLGMASIFSGPTVFGRGCP
ncbi:MAG: DUF1320 domain-containing protein [Magnetococcus sp. THC-1_WYH]